MRIAGIFFEELPRSVVALDRIDEILELENPMKNSFGTKTTTNESLKLEIKGLEARYGDQLILDNINFTIDPGEIVALVGPTGVGKSTIADMIGGLQKPTAGHVLLGDMRLEEIQAQQKNQILAVAFQESFLFADTVKENILLGRDFEENDIRAALETAQALEFVEHLPEGINTVLGERGVSLSGGQRQRITLARALVGEPKIIFLDDSTSSVDPVIEKKILNNLRLHSDVSLLIVAHRLSTIKLADRVIFLNKGKVEGTGTHEELMESKSYSTLIKAYEINGTIR